MGDKPQGQVDLYGNTEPVPITERPPIPDPVKTLALQAAVPITAATTLQAATAQTEEAALPLKTENPSSWRFTAYYSGKLAGHSHHFGGDQVATGGGRYEYRLLKSATDKTGVTNQWSITDAKGFNKSLRNNNPGFEVNAMTDVFKLGDHTVLEAGASLGKYINSVDVESKYATLNVAVRTIVGTNPLGDVSATVGVQAGPITGYEKHKVGGVLFAQLSQQVSQSFAISFKAGLLPASYKTAHPEENIGKIVTERMSSSGDFVSTNMPTTRIEDHRKPVLTKQIGITGTWRY